MAQLHFTLLYHGSMSHDITVRGLYITRLHSTSIYHGFT